MTISINNLYQTIKNIVEDIIRKQSTPPFEFFVVTDSKMDTYRVNIRSINNSSIQFDDVPVAGIGLGNFKGIVNIPVKDDLVLVGYLSKNIPIVIGSLYSQDLSTNRGNITDIIPGINNEELLLTNKAKGATIHLKEADKIVFNKGTIGIARKGDNVIVAGKTEMASGHYHDVYIVGTISEGSDEILVN